MESTFVTEERTEEKGTDLFSRRENKSVPFSSVPFSSASFDVDVLIIGGGIAGLWTLDLLRRHGYLALLLEQDALGGGQTAAAQGMIHGGLKYRLDGQAGASSRTIAAMPALWNACLRGEAQPDLRGARLLSPYLLMWSAPGATARVTTFLASHALRGRSTRLDSAELPAALGCDGFSTSAWRLDDPVLDVASLINTLAQRNAGHIHRVDWNASEFLCDADGRVSGMRLAGLELNSTRTVLCAGAGNGALLQRLGADSPMMQRRPLHQVLLKHASLQPLYGHVIGAGMRPRLTLSSHRHSDGQWLWYLGGELAESGVQRSEAQQIEAARQEIATLFPWLELEGAQWRTLRIDRAEPRQRGLLRPDDAFAESIADGSVLVGWPTKLALAPRLAERLLQLLAIDVKPTHRPLPADAAARLASALGPVPVAAAPWEALFPCT
jgi:glycerol-3-phosphate dehydrogenase